MTTTVPYRLLEAVLASKHVPVLMTGEGTHDAALAFVAQLVPFTQDEDRVRAIVGGALPTAYAGDTLKQVPEMLKSAIRKRFDQAKPMPTGVKKKRNEVDDAVDFFFESGAEVFQCPLERAYVRIPAEDGGFINYPVKSSKLKVYLMRLYRKMTGLILSKFHVEEAAFALFTIALSEGESKDVAIRIGGDRKKVVIDLGRADGQLVEIDHSGYRLTFDSDVRLIRTTQLAEMPLPVPGEAAHAGFDAFARLLNLEGSDKVLILGYMVGALSTSGPYACLLVEGQQNSGKSALCEAIKDIVDPGNGLSNRVQNDERDLLISASRRHLSMFDNQSFIRDDMSDTLCCLATGIGKDFRELYSDDGVVNFTMAKPFILCGITSFVRAPDLMSRTIPIQLRPIPIEKRMDPEDLKRALKEIRPMVMHDLFTALSQAIANVDSTAVPREIRMLGIGRWVEAASEAIGFERGAFVAAVRRDVGKARAELVRNKPLTLLLIEALRGFTEEQPFIGSPTELYNRLKIDPYKRDKFLPANAQALFVRLEKDAQDLAEIDVHIVFPSRKSDERTKRAWLGPSYPVEKPRNERPRQDF